MTTEQAAKIAQDIRSSGAVWDKEAWEVVWALMTLHDYYKATCKTENRPSDARSTTAWMDMPESPNDAISDNFRPNTIKHLYKHDKEIMQCETEIQMLWDAVEAMRERLPREWKK